MYDELERNCRVEEGTVVGWGIRRFLSKEGSSFCCKNPVLFSIKFFPGTSPVDGCFRTGITTLRSVIYPHPLPQLPVRPSGRCFSGKED